MTLQQDLCTNNAMAGFIQSSSFIVVIVSTFNIIHIFNTTHYSTVKVQHYLDTLRRRTTAHNTGPYAIICPAVRIFHFETILLCRRRRPAQQIVLLLLLYLAFLLLFELPLVLLLILKLLLLLVMLKLLLILLLLLFQLLLLLLLLLFLILLSLR